MHGKLKAITTSCLHNISECQRGEFRADAVRRWWSHDQGVLHERQKRKTCWLRALAVEIRRKLARKRREEDISANKEAVNEVYKLHTCLSFIGFGNVRDET